MNKHVAQIDAVQKYRIIRSNKVIKYKYKYLHITMCLQKTFPTDRVGLLLDNQDETPLIFLCCPVFNSDAKKWSSATSLSFHTTHTTRPLQSCWQTALRITVAKSVFASKWETHKHTELSRSNTTQLRMKMLPTFFWVENWMTNNTTVLIGYNEQNHYAMIA